MDVGNGIIYPISVVDGLVYQLGGWKLKLECQMVQPSSLLWSFKLRIIQCTSSSLLIRYPLLGASTRGFPSYRDDQVEAIEFSRWMTEEHDSMESDGRDQTNSNMTVAFRILELDVANDLVHALEELTYTYL